MTYDDEGKMASLDTSCRCLAAAVANLKDLGANFSDMVRHCGDPKCPICVSCKCPEAIRPRDAQVKDEEELAADAAARKRLSRELTGFFPNPGAPLPKLCDEDEVADFIARAGGGAGEGGAESLMTEFDAGENSSQLIDEYIAEYAREQRAADFDGLEGMEVDPTFLEQFSTVANADKYGEPWEMVNVREQQVGLVEIEDAALECAIAGAAGI
ncbi:MAG: hypothetical protein Q9163_005165 [Psora crenata]